MKVAAMGILALVLTQMSVVSVEAGPSKTERAVTAREQRQMKCAKLDQSLRDVRSKMRAGYGVKEGERLKARQRQLAGQRRMQKCG